MAKFNMNGFIRECYLRSTPSVDLDEVTSENPIRCSDHKLPLEKYDALLHEFGVTDERGKTLNHDAMLACNMWMLMSGPLVINKAA